MKKEFEKICRMSQKNLKNHLHQVLKNKYDNVVNEDGFLFAKGNIPVLLVAHMDTVHKELPEMFVYNAKSSVISSPQGIGGDDRCGVYMILDIIDKIKCSVLFCEDEEIGAVGADKFTKTELAKTLEFNYIIEFDRAHANDAVFYNCDNIDFEEFITKDFYKTSFGSFSDISVLAPFLGCAAVNLSCGYYNAHMKSEYVNLKEMQESINHAIRIIERTTAEDKFAYIPAKTWYSKYNYSGSKSSKSWNYVYDDYHDSYDTYDDSKYYVIEYYDMYGRVQWFDTFAVSKAEALGKLFMQDSTVCYDMVSDIVCDDSMNML